MFFAMRALQMRMKMSKRLKPHKFDLISEAIIYYALLLLFVAWQTPNTKYRVHIQCMCNTLQVQRTQCSVLVSNNIWINIASASSSINRLQLVCYFVHAWLVKWNLMNYGKARNLNTSCNTIRSASDSNVPNAHKLNYYYCYYHCCYFVYVASADEMHEE